MSAPFKLSDSDIKHFVGPMHKVWGCINSDMPETTDNEVAIETVFDADHMMMYGGPEGRVAANRFENFCKKYDYLVVLKEFASRIKLV
jgi:hypothetical protein